MWEHSSRNSTALCFYASVRNYQSELDNQLNELIQFQNGRQNCEQFLYEIAIFLLRQHAQRIEKLYDGERDANQILPHIRAVLDREGNSLRVAVVPNLQNAHENRVSIVQIALIDRFDVDGADRSEIATVL